MRRGLISRSETELPDAVLDARIARVRAAMAEARPRRAAALHQQHAHGRRILAHRLRALLVGGAAGGAARARAGPGGRADVPGQELDRAHQPRRRGGAHAAHRARSRAHDRGVERRCRGGESPISTGCPPASSRICARAARGSPCATRRGVRGAARQGGSGGDRARGQGRVDRAPRAGAGVGTRSRGDRRRGRGAGAHARRRGGLHRRRARPRARPPPQAHRRRGARWASASRCAPP